MPSSWWRMTGLVGAAWLLPSNLTPPQSPACCSEATQRTRKGRFPLKRGTGPCAGNMTADEV